MKGKLLVLAMVSSGLVSGFVHAQDTITSELKASLRLGLGLTTEPEAELTFNDYASRIGWKGSADAGKGLKAISRVEFGYDQDNGVSNTRYAYLGVIGDFGTVTGGKQYAAFYDAVTSAVDIAYWGSCAFEFSCGRQTSILKYVGPETSKIQFMASTQLVEGATGTKGDFIDVIDLGATTKSGDMSLGAALSLDLETDGIGLGFSVTMPLDDATVSGTVQLANEEFLNSTDDGILVTGTYKKDQYYGIVGIANSDNTPLYATLGYEKSLIADKAFTYFEISLSDADLPGSDMDFEMRAVMVYNLDILSTGN